MGLKALKTAPIPNKPPTTQNLDNRIRVIRINMKYLQTLLQHVKNKDLTKKENRNMYVHLESQGHPKPRGVGQTVGLAKLKQ